MRLSVPIHVSLALALASCKFPDLPAIGDDAGSDAVATDAVANDAAIDAPLPCQAGVTECNDDTDVYTRCTAEGTVDLQFACSLGCADDREQCVEFVATNDVTQYLDQARDLPASLDVVFTGQSSINTGGVVFNGGTSIEVPYTIGPRGEGVFMFRSITLVAGATLRVHGNRPAILLAGRDVEIQGIVDASADNVTPGPGGRECQSGDGALGFGGTPPNAGPGAGGAGGAFGGGLGGRGGNGTDGAAGGVPSVTTVPLVGGCTGGPSFNGLSQTWGGAGGGAIQITSRTTIRVLGEGVIDASGGGASAGLNGDLYAGAGGGSGGAVVLEAPQVVLDGAGVVVSTKGGGGAAAATNTSPTRHGEDGGYGPAPAAGGTSPGMPRGGAGGIDTSPEGGEAAPAGASPGGGGGGSGGRVLMVTRTGQFNPQNGAAVRSQRQSAMLIPRYAP